LSPVAVVEEAVNPATVAEVVAVVVVLGDY
jgi:hypothetical protein